MFLKELEIYGFKSFPKRTKISFNSGITAIVGPNGCGKSNIADAVRWVLGEQNIRSLRGKKITDIIFSGNHNSNPLNVAEVSLTLDNSSKILPMEWEEINIKRRIYRSGETENFINGLPCKLREIQRLFMNTGLGKNTYSMIAQGEIDVVLSAKPSDRRFLFEEAALISKYKYEKQKTLKRVEIVDNNLDKINNILSEIKEQLLILKEEVKQLDIYKETKKKIKNIELFLIYQQYNLYNTNMTKINKRIDLYEKEIQGKLKNYDEKEVKIRSINKELDKLNLEIERYNNKNYEFNNQKNQLQNKLNLALQKKIDLDNKIFYISREITNTTTKISLAKNSKKNSRKTIDEIDKNIKSSNDQLKYLQNKYDKNIKILERNNLFKDGCHNMLARVEEKGTLIKEKKIKLETTLNMLKINLNKIQERKELLKSNFKLNNKKIDNFKKAKKVDKLENAEKYLEKNNEKIKEAETKINKEKMSLEKNNQILSFKEERKNNVTKTIRDIEEGNEKIVDNFCLKYYKSYPNDLCTRLVSIIDNIPPKYEKVLEIALKESISSIVVSNSSFAFNIANSLSKNELSGLKIIPIDYIKRLQDLRKDKVALKNKDICGFADRIIDYNEKHDKLFKLLLGNILIVKNIETALIIAKEKAYLGKYQIISLDGIIIKNNGTICFYNDSKGNQKNIFRLNKEVKQLEKELENIRKEILQSEKSIKKYNTIRKYIIEENKKLRNTFLENREKVILAEDNLAELNLQRNNIKNSLHNLKYEENNILKNIDDVSNKYCNINKKYKFVTNFEENIKKLAKLINKVLSKENIEISKIKKNINDIKNHIMLKEEKIKNLHEKEENIHLQLDETDKLLESKRIELKENNLSRNDILKNIKLLKIDIKKMNFKESNCREQLKEIKKELGEKSILLENILIEKRKSQEYYDQIRDKKYKEEISKAQYGEKIDNIKNEILKNYKLSVEKLDLFKKECSSKKEANLQLNILRDKTIEMGQINFDADKKYSHQSERYSALQVKYDEILQAKQSLLILISKIDNIAKERFRATFNQVKRYFNEIFKNIFSGGEGELQLTFNNDILQSGIDVIASPPGKKTRNMELLSAGEKALTAIALLLALWKVNPSPFCFFDEIDTALDESNAERLSSILKEEGLKKAQLIIITHQKSTMEAADALCGITMQESGISKLVSVKFNN
ncbi:MAG: chromosome segregation protein SMC [Candidatus Caldatribacteriota bacterium]|nr:chromosome segregation protein SMC [Candidatus Caldatribacteriota bacterium]